MKQIILLLVFITTIISANTNRSLYIKKYKNEKKIALIIGNNDYQHFSKLKNSKNDASDMRYTLSNLGFEVLYLENGTLRDMKKIVKKFGYKLKHSGVGFFYYAGHGLEVEGKNYLIPTNAKIDDKEDVEFESLAVNRIIKKMEYSKNRLNIVVLDACRNDPFSRGGGGGLAPINNAKGMYIAFATAPGEVASDGSERNGLFTKYLIENIQKSNITLNEVFKKTRQSVYERSNAKQMPWTSSSIIGDFYFKVDGNVNYQQKNDNTNELLLKRLADLEKKLNIQKEQNNKNIWIDHDTGLIWQDEPYTYKEKEAYKFNDYYGQNYGKVLDWKKAKRYCKNLILSGYSDWYLPTKDQLKDLYKKKDRLKNVVSDYYWSSSSYTSNSNYAWDIYFKNGYVFNHYKSYKGYIRCVHDK